MLWLHTVNKKTHAMSLRFDAVLSQILNQGAGTLVASPQTFCGQQLVSSARLMITSPARRHTRDSKLEQLYSTGTMVSLSQRYMQHASLEAFHTSPFARGNPELSVQAADTHTHTALFLVYGLPFQECTKKHCLKR